MDTAGTSVTFGCIIARVEDYLPMLRRTRARYRNIVAFLQLKQKVEVAF